MECVHVREWLSEWMYVWGSGSRDVNTLCAISFWLCWSCFSKAARRVIIEDKRAVSDVDSPNSEGENLGWAAREKLLDTFNFLNFLHFLAFFSEFPTPLRWRYFPWPLLYFLSLKYNPSLTHSLDLGVPGGIRPTLFACPRMRSTTGSARKGGGRAAGKGGRLCLPMEARSAISITRVSGKKTKHNQRFFFFGWLLIESLKNIVSNSSLVYVHI